jgi:hypothetical protein
VIIIPAADVTDTRADFAAAVSDLTKGETLGNERWEVVDEFPPP